MQVHPPQTWRSVCSVLSVGVMNRGVLNIYRIRILTVNRPAVNGGCIHKQGQNPGWATALLSPTL